MFGILQKFLPEVRKECCETSTQKCSKSNKDTCVQPVSKCLFSLLLIETLGVPTK